MNKLSGFKIISKEELIVEYHSGEINADDFIYSRKVISSDLDYNPNFDLILDIRNANLNVSKEDITRFVDFVKKSDFLKGKRRSAYLTRTPNDVVITTLVTRLIKDISQPKIFSTIDAVVRWYGSKNIDTDMIIKIITELKTHPNILYK